MHFHSVLPRRLLLCALLAAQEAFSLPTEGFTSISRPKSSALERRYDWAAVVKEVGASWTTEVIIGGQKLNLLVDTGSSDLWVYSPEVRDPGNHTLYNWRKSPGAQILTNYAYRGAPPVTETFDITYAFPDSNVQGYVVQEPNVDVGAAETPMPVGVATSVGDGMKRFEGMDGILGLGFKELNHVKPAQMMTLLDWLRINKDEKDRPTDDVFTVYFDPNNAEGRRTPSIEIGKIDRQKANGKNLGHVPVNNQSGYWNVDNISFEVNGAPITQTVNGVANTYTQRMLFDTGGSGSVQVELPVAQGYYSSVPHINHTDGTFSVRCDATLPALKLYLGNDTASYPGTLLKGAAAREGDGWCQGVVVGNGGNNVGAMFFQSHYVVFKYDEPAILYSAFPA